MFTVSRLFFTHCLCWKQIVGFITLSIWDASNPYVKAPTKAPINVNTEMKRKEQSWLQSRRQSKRQQWSRRTGWWRKRLTWIGNPGSDLWQHHSRALKRDRVGKWGTSNNAKSMTYQPQTSNIWTSAVLTLYYDGSFQQHRAFQQQQSHNSRTTAHRSSYCMDLLQSDTYGAVR